MVLAATCSSAEAFIANVKELQFFLSSHKPHVFQAIGAVGHCQIKLMEVNREVY